MAHAVPANLLKAFVTFVVRWANPLLVHTLIIAGASAWMGSNTNLCVMWIKMNNVKWIVVVCILFTILIMATLWILLPKKKTDYSKTLYLTSAKRNDGFGAQYLTIMFAFVFVQEKLAKQFVYRPLSTIEHNYNNDPSFNNMLEHLMNVKDNLPKLSQFQTKDYQVVDCIDAFPQKTQEVDQIVQSASFARLRAWFWQNKSCKNPETVTRKDKLVVAIHLRRPNPHDCKPAVPGQPHTYALEYLVPLRMINIDYFRGILDKLKVDLSVPFEYHIYSQGPHDTLFLPFESLPVKFHIDERVDETFVSLVQADILIMSPSALSYAAALLNDHGLIVYPPFQGTLPPSASHWLVDYLNPQKASSHRQIVCNWAATADNRLVLHQ